MRKIQKILVIMLVALATTLSANLFAQDAPPPPPAGGHGQSGNKGAAPIGGGLFILLGLGAAYGGKKLYDLRKEKLEE